jgi:hypothetical protein
MENKNPLRTLYIVQLITIIILVLLLIQAILPFFGIYPPGKQPPQYFTKPGPGSSYSSPAPRQTGDIDSAEPALALSSQMIIQNALDK